MIDHARVPTLKPLVIFGAGSLARLAYAYFDRDTEYRVAACTVHRRHVASSELHQLPVVPFEDLADHYPNTLYAVFVAVGYTQLNARRAEIFDECVALGYELVSHVSATAQSWPDLSIGRNCLVFDGVVIEPNVVIGDDVIIWSGSQISHDASLADHTFVGPNAVILGGVSIGARSFIGGNATVQNGVTIAPNCVVGAGAIVKADTHPGEVYSAPRTRARPGRTAVQAESDKWPDDGNNE